jgi:hypothetical protein
MRNNDEEAQRKLMLEQQAGMAALARQAIAREFDPDYVPTDKADEGPNSHISAAERARRDEYRKHHVINWSKLDRDRSNA